jgi:hypothetical protein
MLSRRVGEHPRPTMASSTRSAVLMQHQRRNVPAEQKSHVVATQNPKSATIAAVPLTFSPSGNGGYKPCHRTNKRYYKTAMHWNLHFRDTIYSEANIAQESRVPANAVMRNSSILSWFCRSRMNFVKILLSEISKRNRGSRWRSAGATTSSEAGFPVE